jgi:hypothetical protein
MSRRRHVAKVDDTAEAKAKTTLAVSLTAEDS